MYSDAPKGALLFIRTILAASICFVACTQAQSAGEQPEQTTVAAHGTLNVLLANRNGFVIATDSRLTRSDGTHSDDGQKLFRTSPDGAVSFAGFAGFAADLIGTKFEFEIPATFLGRFGPDGLSDGRGSPMFVADWASGLSLYLTKVSIITSTFPRAYAPSPLVVTVAGLNRERLPEIRQVTLIPSVRALGVGGQEVPVYESQEAPPVVASKFQSRAEGVYVVARKILSGEYSGRDPILKKYVKSLKEKRLDGISLPEMKSIAEALFRETEATHLVVNGRDYSQTVGGEIQMGIFPAKGAVEWRQQTFPSKVSLLSRTGLEIGAVYVNQERQKGPSLLQLSDSFTEPINVPFHMFYYGNQFRDSRIALDGNIFIRNSFQHCMFDYSGGEVLLYENAINECKLVTHSNRPIPPEVASQLSHCTLVPSKN